MKQSEQCAKCKHFHWDSDEPRWCKAFPDAPGIPWEIVDGKFIHDKVHPKQLNGVLFEAKEKK